VMGFAQPDSSAGLNLLYRRFPNLLNSACGLRVADKEVGDTAGSNLRYTPAAGSTTSAKQGRGSVPIRSYHSAKWDATSPKISVS
jgi:hypothetical protein